MVNRFARARRKYFFPAIDRVLIQAVKDRNKKRTAEDKIVVESLPSLYNHIPTRIDPV